MPVPFPWFADLIFPGRIRRQAVLWFADLMSAVEDGCIPRG